MLQLKTYTILSTGLLFTKLMSTHTLYISVIATIFMEPLMNSVMP